MTKVCLVSLYAYKLFHPQDERALSFGGSEVQQYQLGKELVKDKNFEISFLVGDFYDGQPDAERVRVDGGVLTLYKTARCHGRNMFIDGVADFWRLYRAMKKTSADVYMIRGGGSLAGKVAFLAKKILRRKFIYSSAHDRDSNLDFFDKKPWYVNVLFRYALNNADAVICQHKEQQDAFKKNFGITATVIPSMYAIEDESQIGGRESREYILWVGRLASWKQPEVFVRLAEKFPKEKFLFITNSDTSQFRYATNHIGNLEIKKNVPFEDTDYYFKKAKIFVNTSSSEGFPNTFVQAAKNGTPILSLQVNPESILGRYEIGKLANGSFEKLVNDLANILDDKRAWDKMSENAYIYAKENHNISRIAGQYGALFGDIVIAH
ncbi:hypothetical protein A3H10_03515 [Candidatus Uhrbacteria bacterium RIFCSPLOWO2_12_FULL_46_10]|uniref:Glycosyl transferase family 1 domain-containing protein n=1 Tax=Candidatus Uhrbacteria bacterium RIFCSPLOWO2_01_FULL_47_25 TaxID=1802402 RepID=A0A1F7UPU8_9BACT|nr:MAG: hypothetical protein UX68_C0020G0025 [Parcubacteria group bacterium GW2011_GWA2_46_9]OGL80296.1 MAG: hypothetical protein A2936_02925 [Candidatus Uhrbacteria bacterium RIFCSPLOWO2_01_FULL_47_25]OGL91316.1 MAG: hypothetical protein A3H10_03515 [Candidatus Uhrbacteria bacterium RIFCSPLOWO2_12_FULL_46_10]